MKSKPFLIFTAVIIISAIVLILYGIKTKEIVCLTFGYICGLSLAATETEKKIKNLAEDAERFKNSNFSHGDIISVGIVIGVILAFIGNKCFDIPWLISLFAILGSALGSVVGCLYKSD